jgi:hypothetical protein
MGIVNEDDEKTMLDFETKEELGCSVYSQDYKMKLI